MQLREVGGLFLGITPAQDDPRRTDSLSMWSLLFLTQEFKMAQAHEYFRQASHPQPRKGRSPRSFLSTSQPLDATSGGVRSKKSSKVSMAGKFVGFEWTQKKGATRFPFQIHVCGSLFSEGNQSRSNHEHQACSNGSAPLISRPGIACGPNGQERKGADAAKDPTCCQRQLFQNVHQNR